jgi:hypothetical protein
VHVNRACFAPFGTALFSGFYCRKFSIKIASTVQPGMAMTVKEMGPVTSDLVAGLFSGQSSVRRLGLRDRCFDRGDMCSFFAGVVVEPLQGDL